MRGSKSLEAFLPLQLNGFEVTRSSLNGKLPTAQVLGSSLREVSLASPKLATRGPASSPFSVTRAIPYTGSGLSLDTAASISEVVERRAASPSFPRPPMLQASPKQTVRRVRRDLYYQPSIRSSLPSSLPSYETPSQAQYVFETPPHAQYVAAPREGYVISEHALTSEVFRVATQPQEAEVIRVVAQPQVRQASPPPALCGAYASSRCHLEPAVAELQSLIIGLQLGFQNEVRAREALTFSLAHAVDELNATRQQVGQLESDKQTMQSQIQHLNVRLQEEAQENVVREEIMRANREKIDNMKGHLSSDDDLEKRIHAIEVKGNVKVNFDSGEVHLIRPISFVPRTTRDSPTAEFNRPDMAKSICQDLADLMALLQCSLTIEGHTKGGEGEFWQTLALNRANVVADKIIEAGGVEDRISSLGKPGNLGRNETRTVVQFTLPEVTRTSLRKHSSHSA